MSTRGQGMTRRAIVVAVVIALLALLALAFVAEWFLGDRGAASEVRVTRHGVTVASFSMEELRAMETVEFVQSGIAETGPSILAVLERAGVDDFERLTALGLGERDDGILVLDRDEVTPEVILDFADTRGTVKVAGPEISRDERVRDVTELQVE